MKLRLYSIASLLFITSTSIFAHPSVSDKPLTYSSAGVVIDASDQLVEKIRPYCKETNRTGCFKAEIGGYGSLFDMKQAVPKMKNPILVSGTDGVGTKLLLAQKVADHTTIGIDLVAMSANDVLTRGAQPLYFLDYYATGKLNVEDATQVIASVAEGCKQAGCGLLGGETAQMPGIYEPNVYDLAGFTVGVVDKSDLLPRKVNAGDVLIGLSSSGLHSNGFSLVRKVIDKNALSLDAAPPFASSKKTLAAELLTPTTIYVKTVMPALNARLIEAMAHITGSGMPGNLPRVYANNLVASIDTSTWNPPAVFTWIHTAGPVASTEMLNTFNCGVGMILVVKPQNVDQVLKLLATSDVKAFRMGVMRERKGTEAQVEFIGDLFAKA